MHVFIQRNTQHSELHKLSSPERLQWTVQLRPWNVLERPVEAAAAAAAVGFLLRLQGHVSTWMRLNAKLSRPHNYGFSHFEQMSELVIMCQLFMRVPLFRFLQKLYRSCFMIRR